MCDIMEIESKNKKKIIDFKFIFTCTCIIECIELLNYFYELSLFESVSREI